MAFFPPLRTDARCATGPTTPAAVDDKELWMRLTRIAAVFAVVAAIAAPTALALAFLDSDFPLPQATVGLQYNFQLNGRAGCPPYVWTVISGSLPPGIQLTTGGNITGVPTQPGTWSFYVDLADTGCTLKSHSQRAFTLSVIPRVKVTTPTLTPGVVGVPYSAQMTADGGGTIVWSVSSGSLPAGLTLSSTGLLAGTPTTPGVYPFQVLAKDTSSTRSDTGNLTLEILAPLGATIGTPPAAEVGVPFKGITPAATGGKPPYTWAASGLPAGLTADPATGAITGTPTAAGAFAGKLTVTDAYKGTTTVDVAVTVAPKLAVLTRRLPSGKVGAAFAATVRTRGGVPPLTWKVTSGRFPVGLRLNTKTGVLAGRPKTAGRFTITVTVTDALKATSAQAYSFTIKAKPKPKTKAK
jgi:Putative Ig domain